MCAYKIILLSLVLISFDLADFTETFSECIDQDWFKLDEKCIYLSKFKLNFEQSKNFCKIKFNASRLTISTKLKQDLIVNYLNNLYKSNHPINFDQNNFKIWIGLNRINFKGRSLLLWDNELENFSKLNDDINHPNSIKINQNYLIKHHHKSGLIDLRGDHDDNKTYHDESKTTLPFLEPVNLTKEKLIKISKFLKFDNRFRINQVDRHFYITNKTDKWLMSFSSSNKFYTICEKSVGEGKKSGNCNPNWHPIYHGETRPNKVDKCIRFIKLSKPSTFNEIKKICKEEFNESDLKLKEDIKRQTKLSNQLLKKVDILRLKSLEELKNLIKLLEFESISFQNAAWLIQLDNLTSFDDVFEHKPLFTNSCFQLLPKHMIERHKRDFVEKVLDLDESLKITEDAKNLKKSLDTFLGKNTGIYRKDKNQIGKSSYDRLENENFETISLLKIGKRISELNSKEDAKKIEKVYLVNKIKEESAKQLNGEFVDVSTQSRAGSEEKIIRLERRSNKIVENKKVKSCKCFKNSNEQSVNAGSRRELVDSKMKKKRSMIVESHFLHFLHEFDCNALFEFAICSYSLDEAVKIFTSNNVSTKMEGTLENKNKEETMNKQNQKNRFEHQRSLWNEKLDNPEKDGKKNLTLASDKQFKTKFTNSRIDYNNYKIDKNENNLNDIEISNIKDDDKNKILKKNYLITFDLISKLALVFITINLFFFIFICIRVNQNQNQKKARKTSGCSTTHVHFDNCDNSLKFH